jgi:mannan endo-1,4-beta-mannosidase
VEKPWQQASLALATKGMGGDMFWQWGDKLSNGQQTANDGNTIYYGSSDGTCLITDHVNAIKALP